MKFVFFLHFLDYFSKSFPEFSRNYKTIHHDIQNPKKWAVECKVDILVQIFKKFTKIFWKAGISSTLACPVCSSVWLPVLDPNIVGACSCLPWFLPLALPDGIPLHTQISSIGRWWSDTMSALRILSNLEFPKHKLIISEEANELSSKFQEKCRSFDDAGEFRKWISSEEMWRQSGNS